MQVFNVQGMTCGHCVKAVTRAVQEQDAAGAAALVGLLHDGSAVPMALVISLCGALAVSVALLTRRLQAKAPA